MYVNGPVVEKEKMSSCDTDWTGGINAFQRRRLLASSWHK